MALALCCNLAAGLLLQRAAEPRTPRPLLAAPTSRSRQALDTEIKYMGVCILRSYTSCEEEALSSLVHRPGGKIFQACDFFTAMGTKSNY